MWIARSLLTAGLGMALFGFTLTACGPSDAPIAPEPVAPEPIAPEPVEARPASQLADVRAPQVAAAYEPGCVTLTAPDFEPSVVGCSSIGTAVLRNTCSVPVIFYGFETSPSTGSPQRCDSHGYCSGFFLIAHDPIPAAGLTLPPGASASAKVKYQPLDEVGSDTGMLAGSFSYEGAVSSTQAVLTGTVVPMAPFTEIFTKSPRSRADVLIVVDTSPSMVPRMPEVREGLRAFLDMPLTSTFDLRVGVVAAHQPGAGVVAHPESGARYFTDWTPALGTRVDELMASLERAGSEPSQPLAAAAAAVLPPLTPSPDGGFSRPEASLEVLVFTDKPDRSSDSVKNLVERMQGTRTDPNSVTITVVGPFSEACGIADDGRLAQAVSLSQYTVGIHSICDPEWEAPFLSPVLGMVVWPERFLSSVPTDPGAMEVEVELPNGSRSLLPPDGWTYDPITRSVSIRDFWDHPWDTTYRISYTREYCW